MGNKYCLTKADIADSIYSALPVDKQKASQLIELYIDIIKEGLEKDGKVMLSGFGSFEVKEKNARRGRNPQTGDSLTLKERRVVKFKVSQLFKKNLNGQATGDEEDEY